uniref:ComEA family DNA-binding protein n=1 Tax=Thaumasiovibrio occultus TaxID=1891184 RepID=UPI000B35263A|nr:helix-hairpin-helix domain-containing protein [Thaumasiovibrio occultus]
MKKLIAVFALVLMVSSPLAIAADNAGETAPEIVTVNINTATLEELDLLLTGIGEEKARAIVEYREANGAFSAVEDLVNVKGIGDATLAKNLERIVLE